MTQDVRQWLAEIKLLQQKLITIQQERDEAYASAANWRSLYETEAKQRRTEATLAQRTIDSLKAEIQRLQEIPLAEDNTEASALIQAEVNQWQNVDDLKVALVKTLMECDRLSRALKSEQTAHAQTRKALTTALGDTVDLLAKERAARPRTRQRTDQHSSAPVNLVSAAKNGSAKSSAKHGASNGVSNGGSAAQKLEAKTPSLELPQLD